MPDHIEDQPLRRSDNGYFEQVSDGHAEECDTEDDRCAPGDDEYSEDRHVPGTVDDLPYSYGEETVEPADMHLSERGFASIAGEKEPTRDIDDELADRDLDTDLWTEQQDLISIDENSGYNVEDFSAEETERIAEALGDDAAERNQESSGGTSATGSVSALEHGGFPEE